MSAISLINSGVAGFAKSAKWLDSRNWRRGG